MYDDPFATTSTLETGTDDYPPEATATKGNIGLTIGLIATALVAIGFIVGWLAGHSKEIDES